MKIKHATIGVADMAESIKFYTEIMGLDIDHQFNPYPGVTITFLKGEWEAMIELIENVGNPQNTVEDPQNKGLLAVGIEVEDMNTTVKELKSKGAKITREPTQMPAGILALLEDPNGVRIALVQH